MVKAAEELTARARARQAKAQLDVQRAEQDRLIVDAATQFYEAAESLAVAQAAAAAAELARTTAVTRLVELGQTDTHIATLCGIGVKQVRELRRGAKSQPKTNGSDPPATGPTVEEPTTQKSTTTHQMATAS